MTPPDPIAEARRLRALADVAKARLDELEEQRFAALDGCGHGPSPGAIEDARRFAEATEAKADAAERMAGKGVAA